MPRATVLLGASFVLLVLLVLGIVTAAWSLRPANNGNDDAPGGAAGDSLQQLPASFTISRFTSFDEAESVAGYHIPRTSTYPLRWGFVYLQPSPRPSSAPEARAIYVGPRETSLHFHVLAPGVWSEGPPGGSLRKATLGGWEGEVLEDEDDYAEFAFQCTEFEGSRLWCVISAPDQNLDELDQFLATLR
jgi:hypothetical protein